MNVHVEANRIGVLLLKLGLKENTKSYAYYKYAVELASTDTAKLNQMIKDVYQPMSIYFNETISEVEREMRKTIASIYREVSELFEDMIKERTACYPTVSEVLAVLVCFNNRNN